MRKIIASEFVTIDGVMEDPGGAEGFKHGGWSLKFFSPEYGKYKGEELNAAGALLLGRKTYEGFAAAWPGRTDEYGFADKMNGLPKYVVSTTMQKADWNNSIVINGDLVKEIQTLKDMPGQDILVAGSAQLVRTLLAEELIDEIRLMIHPIVLGEGKKLFAEGTLTTTMKLIDSQVFSSGTVVHAYEPAKQNK